MTLDPLVTSDGAREAVTKGAITPLDATWFLPGTGDARAAYEEAHLPSAIFFDIDAIADLSSGLPHMLPSPEAFAQAMGALGVSAEDDLVIYDRAPIPSAARAWWTFRVMGHRGAVRVLDGGLAAWRAAGGATEAGAVERPPVRYRPGPARPDLVADFDRTLAALRSGSAQMVDARPPARFRGEAPEPRAGLKSGHAPGSLNLPAGAAFDADGRMLDRDALQARFEGAGVDLRRPVVASCGSGVTAGVIALGLARLGHEAAVYDGSWAEWGARSDAPVVAP